MEQQKTISVIIPAHNEERYLSATISSLRAQTSRAQEIIVVTNGSTDGTPAIARELADVCIEYPHKMGPSAARNAGASKARGDLLVFLDADSIISVHTLEAIAAKATAQSIGTCYARPDQPIVLARIFFVFKNILHWTGLYKGVLALLFCDRALFDTVGGFDPRLYVGEYKDLIERVRAKGGVYTFVKNAEVTTSIRRFEEQGFFRMLWFWTRWAFSYQGDGKVRYPPIRQH